MREEEIVFLLKNGLGKHETLFKEREPIVLRKNVVSVFIGRVRKLADCQLEIVILPPDATANRIEKVLMVTHLLSFARRMYEETQGTVEFLSAERKKDGSRTFKMTQNEPQLTSFKLDLYEQIIS